MCCLLAPSSLIVQQDAIPELFGGFLVGTGERCCVRSPSFWRPVFGVVFSWDFGCIMNWRRAVSACSRTKCLSWFCCGRWGAPGLILFPACRNPWTQRQCSSCWKLSQLSLWQRVKLQNEVWPSSGKEECELSTSFLPRFNEWVNNHFLKYCFIERFHLTVVDEFVYFIIKSF